MFCRLNVIYFTGLPFLPSSDITDYTAEDVGYSYMDLYGVNGHLTSTPPSLQDTIQPFAAGTIRGKNKLFLRSIVLQLSFYQPPVFQVLNQG